MLKFRDIFTGKSDKFVVIVGPCSADNEDSVCEYISRLAKVNEKSIGPPDDYSADLHEQTKDNR